MSGVRSGTEFRRSLAARTLGRVQVNPSPAELAILKAIADGLTVPEVALLLEKGEPTVKSQLARVRLKVGARNTSHAVAIALRRGLIQ